MTRYAVPLGLAGIQLGILGLIIAAGSSDAARQSGNALWFGVIAWLVGLVLVVGAFLAAVIEGKSRTA